MNAFIFLLAALSLSGCSTPRSQTAGSFEKSYDIINKDLLSTTPGFGSRPKDQSDRHCEIINGKTECYYGSH